MGKLSEAIHQFNVIDGGKEDFPITKTAPKGPDSPDWLRTLGQNTRFVCRGKNNRGCFLDNYGIAQVLPYSILIYNFFPQYGASPYVFVDSLKFSQDHVLVEILPENPPQEEEAINNEHHLSLPEPREVDDGHEGPA